MKFLKKEKERKVQVTCNCGADYQIECNELQVMERGYKGGLTFYTRCVNCSKTVFFKEKNLPNKYIREAYKKYSW